MKAFRLKDHVDYVLRGLLQTQRVNYFSLLQVRAICREAATPGLRFHFDLDNSVGTRVGK